MNLSEVLWETAWSLCSVLMLHPQKFFGYCGALLTGQQIWFRSMTFP